jgi:hypothetical protein
MAGSAPPPDAPPLASQALATANAGFSASPPIAELCGFKIPFFLFSLGFVLPPIPFPFPIPKFRLSLGLNCSLTNPLNVSAGIDSGGGRVSNSDPDPDLQLDQQTG